MTSRRVPRFLSLALPTLLALTLPACIIADPDDDDDSAGDTGTNPGPQDGSTGGGNDPADTDDDPSDTDDDPADTDDDPPADTDDDPPGQDSSGGSADNPNTGTWIYTETGNTINECTFLEDLSNGWGEYQVEADGGAFRVVPSDGTEPFECTASGGNFDCDERLQDTIQSATSELQVLVGITGTLPSADEMNGTQNGQVVCQGADCALAEQVLGTTFPCTFSIEFIGTHAG